jgi:sigma-B regulation protein RsbU (phosphoserine phosphatase)
VVVCSDGVTEARNVANEEFGRDRMLEPSVDARRQVRRRLEQLLSAVNQFARGAPQADDITVLVFRYKQGRCSPPRFSPGATSVALPTDTAACNCAN